MKTMDENQLLRDAMQPLTDEVPPMPEGLHASWMKQIEEDAASRIPAAPVPVRRPVRQQITRYLSMAAALVFVVAGTLLTKDDLLLNAADKAENGAAHSKRVQATGDAYTLIMGTSAYANNADFGAAEEFAADTEAAAPMLARSMTTDSIEPVEPEKKIIRTASITLATRTFDVSLDALKSGCEGQNGWIESSRESVSSSTGLRTAYLTLRVPQSSLDAYLQDASALGRVTYRSESAQDVTESYYDTQSRLNTQLALMARLQSLITASADLTDLLALESQIAETQYEIDRLQSSLNATDRQVTYSTVDVTLREEKEVELTDGTVSLWERVKSAVRTGWNALATFAGDAAVFLVAASPFIAVVAAAAVVVKIIRKRRK